MNTETQSTAICQRFLHGALLLGLVLTSPARAALSDSVGSASPLLFPVSPHAVHLIDDTRLLFLDNSESTLKEMNLITHEIRLIAEDLTSAIRIAPGDLPGTVLVAETGSLRDYTGRILRISLADGERTILAGGFRGTQGAAYHALSHTLFVSDEDGIHRVDMTTGARFFFLAHRDVGALALDPAGDALLFPVRDTYLIKRFSLSSGALETLNPAHAGGIAGRTNGSLVLSPDGRFGFFNAGRKAGIARIDLATGATEVLFAYPVGQVASFVNTGIAVLDADTLLFAWAGARGHELFTLDIPTRARVLIARGAGVQGIAAIPGSTDLLLAGSGSENYLYRGDPRTGVLTPITDWYLNGPRAVAVREDGREALFSRNWFVGAHGSLIRIDLETNELLAEYAFPAYPRGIAYDSSTTALFTAGTALLRIDLATGHTAQVASFADTPTLPVGIALAPDQSAAYVGTIGNEAYSIGERVYRVDLATGAKTLVGFFPFLDPAHVAVDPHDGSVLVGILNRGIWRLDPATGATQELYELSDDFRVHGNFFFEEEGRGTVLLSGGSGVWRVRVRDDSPGLPHIDAISPTSGAADILITITGSNFGDTQDSSIVTFDSTEADVVSWSDTQIEVTVPSLPVGAYDVVITTGGGSSNTIAFEVISLKNQFLASLEKLTQAFQPFDPSNPKGIDQIITELEITGKALSTAQILSEHMETKEMQIRRENLEELFEKLFGLIHLIKFGPHPFIPPFIICPSELFTFCPVDGEVGEFQASAFQLFNFNITVQLNTDAPEVFDPGDRFVTDTLLIGLGLSFSIVEVNHVSDTPDFRIIQISIEGVSEDRCPHSDLSQDIVINACNSDVTNYLLDDGCTIKDKIDTCAAGARNHGKFVSCVSNLTNTLKKDGIISGQEKGAIQSCTAQADSKIDKEAYLKES